MASLGMKIWIALILLTGILIGIHTHQLKELKEKSDLTPMSDLSAQQMSEIVNYKKLTEQTSLEEQAIAIGDDKTNKAIQLRYNIP